MLQREPEGWYWHYSEPVPEPLNRFSRTSYFVHHNPWREEVLGRLVQRVHKLWAKQEVEGAGS